VGHGDEHRDKHHEHLENRAVNQYGAAPAGEIECEIVAAWVGDVPWKVSDDNLRGSCLRLRLRPAGNYSFVFADVPLDWGRMLDAVRKSAGIEGDELLPEAFVGKQARFSLKHYTGRDGSTRASVAKWLPPAKPELKQATPAVVKQAATKVSRNAPPQFGANDDLPF
jgi:hypothetical protein